jgi:DNA-binding MurR/RpiR family transcriptional regulator
MPQTVAERLRAGLDRFPASERRVAHGLLAEYPMRGLGSAADLARRVGVSAPSVTRLIARLGFASYPDLQRALRDELAAQLRSPLAKQVERPPRTRRGQHRELDAFAAALASNLAETFAALPAAEFERAAELLADRRLRVHLIGGRFTDALARYLAVQLRVLRPGVDHLQDQESNWRDQLLDMGRRDLLVVFDIRRYQPSLMRLAEAASARRVRLVLLTDQWLSPIARVATRVLAARVEAPSMWDSNVALLGLAEALLSEVARLDWDRSRRRIAELERIRSGSNDGAEAAAALPQRRLNRPRA